MRVVPVLLLLGLSLSGCLDGDGSDPVDAGPLEQASRKLFDVLPVEELRVAASDGVGLHNAVYRPDTTEPVPVFINFSPYWGDTAETGGDAFAQYLVSEYVPRGFAVVLSAVRGTGHSEGCFEVASDREVADLWDVIDHFASQPWSNGNVAAGGKSYDSTTQNGLVAKMPHPALKGILHVSGITDMYRYNYVNGVPYQNGLTFTPRYAQQYGNSGEHPQGEPFGTLDAYGCQEMAEHAASGTGSAAHGQKDAYWQERDWNRYVGGSDWNGSVFFVHGLQDWNVKPDHILPWLDALPDQVRVRAWLHQDTENLGHVYPMRADWNETMLAWLDSELKGHDNGFWDGPAFDVEGTDGLWRRSDVWPPIATSLPVTDVATSGGPDLGAPGSRRTVSVDPAQYEGAANATGHVRVTGVPRIQLMATPVTADPVLTAVLSVDGAWVGEAVLRAIYADGLEAPTPVVPGQPTHYVLEAYPLDVVLAPGQTLEIDLGAAPRHALANPMGLSGMRYDGAVMVDLSFAPADARADQPEPTPCFAC